MDAPLPTRDLEYVLARTRELWEDVRGESLLLTGGSGFVGSWLLESLLWANDRLDLRVRVAVLTRDAARFAARHPQLSAHPAACIVEGDVRTFTLPAGDHPFAVHAATEATFAGDAREPLGAFARDIDGTRHLLQVAAEHRVRRLLFTSSGAVYGKQPDSMTHVEEDFPGAPNTLDVRTGYGQAKRAAEFMATSHAAALGYRCIVARLFAFVGPRLPLDAHYAVGNFIGDVLARRAIRIAGDGTPVRSYLYAADLAIWLWTLLLRAEASGACNVGSSTPVSIKELAEVVADVAGWTGGVEVATPAAADQPRLRYVPSVEKARMLLGLHEEIPLAEGIRRTLAWHAEGNGGTRRAPMTPGRWGPAEAGLEHPARPAARRAPRGARRRSRGGSGDDE